MKGLIFNLLADLARRADCEDDAWHVALSVSEEVCEELELAETEDRILAEMFIEDTWLGGADLTFRWLLRSGTAYRDEDWDDLRDLEAVSPAFHGSEPSEPSFLEPDLWSRRRPNRQ